MYHVFDIASLKANAQLLAIGRSWKVNGARLRFRARVKV
jgi:hypothetical protein